MGGWIAFLSTFSPPEPARLITPKPGVGAKEIRARGQPVWSGVCAGRGWLGPGGWALSTWVVPALCPLGTSPVALAEVWEAADTAQAHRVAHTSHQVDPAAPAALMAAVVPLSGLAGHSTILCRQEKSHHQQGTGMRGLTLQAAPSGDTVDPPDAHPPPGLPSAGRSRRQAWQRSTEGKVAARGCQAGPPSPAPQHPVPGAPAHLRTCCQHLRGGTLRGSLS